MNYTSDELKDKSREELLAIMVDKFDGIIKNHKIILEYYIKILQELKDTVNVLPDIPKPMGKLMAFLEEEVERLKPRTNPEILVPDMLLEFQDPVYAKRKHSLDSARKREYGRLTRAYDRYKPQLILKMQNLLDRPAQN